MVIVNGFMQKVQRTGGGFLKGVPQPVSVMIGEKIGCNIQVLSQRHDNQDAQNNSYSTASYAIVTDVPVDAEEVELTTVQGKKLGRCRVQGTEELDAVCAYKTTVERYADNTQQ